MKQDDLTQPKRALTRSIVSCRQGRFFPAERDLAEEVLYQIVLNGEPAESIACSPWDVSEAVTGLFYLTGRIHTPDDLTQLEVRPQEGRVYVTAAPVAVPPVKTISQDTGLSPETVIALSRQLEEQSQLFHRTGGVHSAALARNGDFLVRRDDVSRHVAIDRAVGACLRAGLSPDGLTLVFSGRVAAEIVRKAIALGCPAIIARSAPTAYACEAAQKAGLTLIGFARDDTFNLYTCPERIIKGGEFP